MLSFDKLEDLEIIVSAKQKARLEGMTEGKLEGKILEAKNLLLKLLNKKFKQIPDTLTNKVNNAENIEVIENTIENIFDIQSIEEIDNLIK